MQPLCHQLKAILMEQQKQLQHLLQSLKKLFKRIPL